MEQIKAKLKKWGNSMGVVVPANIVNRDSLEEGMEITITIQPRKIMTVGDLRNLLKKHPLPKIKKTTQEALDEIDKELWPENE